MLRPQKCTHSSNLDLTGLTLATTPACPPTLPNGRLDQVSRWENPGSRLHGAQLRGWVLARESLRPPVTAIHPHPSIKLLDTPLSKRSRPFHSSALVFPKRCLTYSLTAPHLPQTSPLLPERDTDFRSESTSSRCSPSKYNGQCCGQRLRRWRILEQNPFHSKGKSSPHAVAVGSPTERGHQSSTHGTALSTSSSRTEAPEVQPCPQGPPSANKGASRGLTPEECRMCGRQPQRQGVLSGC